MPEGELIMRWCCRGELRAFMGENGAEGIRCTTAIAASDSEMCFGSEMTWDTKAQ